MGCKNSRVVEDKEESFNEDELKDLTRSYLNKAVAHKNHGNFDKALECYLSACDLEIKKDGYENEFVEEWFLQISHLYNKINDPKRAILYSKFLVNRLFIRMQRKQIGSVKKFAEACNALALGLSKRGKYFKAIMYADLSNALGYEDKPLKASIIEEMRPTKDETAYSMILNSMNRILEELIQKEIVTLSIAETIKGMANKLTENDFHGEAIFCFRFVLRYFTCENFTDPKYGLKIGLIYVDIARSYLQLKNQVKGVLLLGLARDLLNKNKAQTEVLTLYNTHYQALSEEFRDKKDVVDRRTIQLELENKGTESVEAYQLYFSYADYLIRANRSMEACFLLKRAIFTVGNFSHNDPLARERLGKLCAMIGKALSERKFLDESQFYFERAVPLLKEPEKSETVVALIKVTDDLKKAGRQSFMPERLSKKISLKKNGFGIKTKKRI